MIIIFNIETREISQVIWDDKLPDGLELGSDEKYLVVKGDIDKHKLHKCLMRLDDEERLAEVLEPIKVRVIANKPNLRLNTPILQAMLYFQIEADGVDELTIRLELEEGVPAWVKKKLLEQKIRTYRSINGVSNEVYVEAVNLRNRSWNFKSVEPKEWVFCIDNWMIGSVNILVKAG